MAESSVTKDRFTREKLTHLFNRSFCMTGVFKNGNPEKIVFMLRFDEEWTAI